MTAHPSAPLRTGVWFLAVGAAGTAMAVTLGAHLGTSSAVRWSAVAPLAAIGGAATALVGPWLLPLAREAASGAVRRGVRLRPLTQGATVGMIAALVAAVAVGLFPEVLAPIEIRVGRGIPRIILDQLVWAVPAAGIAGAASALTAWAIVTQREAVTAAGRLIRHAGTASLVAWSVAAINVVAAIVGSAMLADGAVGSGTASSRGAAIVAAGAQWSIAWALWGVASIALLGLFVVLADRARPAWRGIARAAATTAVSVDLVAIVLLAATLPALAPSAMAGEGAVFLAVERTAVVLSGAVANVLQGIIGLALVRAAGRRLHPLVRLLGTVAFAAAIVSGGVLVARPSALTPVVAVSVSTLVAFALGLGWQLAASRRQEPALESTVRRATRALVPLHPIPFAARMRDTVAVDLAVDADVLAESLPAGLVPRRFDGSAHVTVVAGVASKGRPAFLPVWMGLRPTPMVYVHAHVVDEDGQPAVTFLRGWADGTFGAAAVHWLTELQVSRIDLKVQAGAERWVARGTAGSIELVLTSDAGGAGLVTPPHVDAVAVSRAGRRADVTVTADGLEPRPAHVERLRIPFLDPLRGRVVGAAFLGDATYRFSRARWRR